MRSGLLVNCPSERQGRVLRCHDTHAERILRTQGVALAKHKYTVLLPTVLPSSHHHYNTLQSSNQDILEHPKARSLSTLIQVISDFGSYYQSSPYLIGFCDSGNHNSAITTSSHSIDSSGTISKMPSHLRLQASFEPVEAHATYHTSPTLSPQAKKQKMSLTQTYYVASTARSKLGREAARADHDLRLLVGHANLLDQLMVDLADAEKEQEAWFNQSVRKASKPEEPRHIQWIDTISEEVAEDDSDEESDNGSDYDEDAEMFDMMPTIKKMRSPPVTVSSMEIDEEDEEEYDEEYDTEHALSRVASKHSPPELTHDSDSDSDDESMPSSPEAEPAMQFSEKDRQTMTTTSFYDAKSQQGLEDYIMQQAQQPQTLIAAY